MEPTVDSQQVLCAEILAEARRQSEQIVQAARREAEALLARTRQREERGRQQKLEEARAEAARRREQILAVVPLEANRFRLAAVERQLQSIYEEARRSVHAVRVRDGETPVATVRETLAGLAVEAIRQMVGNAFVIELSPGDHAALADGLAGEIARRLGCGLAVSLNLAVDPGRDDAGVVIEDPEGRQVWDNRLPARLERMWPELRRQVALGTALVAEAGPGETET